MKEVDNHKAGFTDIFKNLDEMDLEPINEQLDKQIRYYEFWLAVHYYEVCWAQNEEPLSEGQKGKTYQNVLEKFYSRLSLVTPCLVMTFYMLPKYFLAYGKEKNSYMYNHIDLLIIDEAGQVSPEIAACSFALAKKALVVGDVHQIEPVWGMSSRILDISLANKKGIMDYSILEKKGLTTNNSNVMTVACNSCYYEKFHQRGLFLSEHRRCYNEIIGYCNDLVYSGQLIPLRGSGKNDSPESLSTWPHMGYFNIETDAFSKTGTSRVNRKEGDEIVAWLLNNLQKIKNAYPNKTLNEIVGIITPFKAQSQYLRKRLREELDGEDTIDVGTVHTFQGAEREIILFSSVYGSKDGCFFIDNRKSLMNVAVSRAKDYFFLFGSLDCLKVSDGSASGLLKSYIGENPIK